MSLTTIISLHVLTSRRSESFGKINLDANHDYIIEHLFAYVPSNIKNLN